MANISFEWDEAKDKINRRIHGISFSLAQYAFMDPDRVIARDLKHSDSEKRYFCFGKMAKEIVTVRFTYRENLIRIIGQDIGERERWRMKKRIRYTDEPMDFEVVDDFLPPPEKIALKEDNVRVTITLSKESVKFFKKYAKKTHGHYQTMIREVLDRYSTHYQ